MLCLGRFFSVGGGLVGARASVPTGVLGRTAAAPLVHLGGGVRVPTERGTDARNGKQSLVQALGGRNGAWERSPRRNRSGRNDRHPCHAYFFILFFLQLNEAVYVISAVNGARMRDLSTVPP